MVQCRRSSTCLLPQICILGHERVIHCLGIVVLPVNACVGLAEGRVGAAEPLQQGHALQQILPHVFDLQSRQARQLLDNRGMFWLPEGSSQPTCLTTCSSEFLGWPEMGGLAEAWWAPWV